MYQIFSTENGEDVVFYVPGFAKEDLKVHRSQDYIMVEGSSDNPYVASPTIDYKLKVSSSVRVDPEFNNGVLVLHLKRSEPKTQPIKIR